MLCNLGSMEQYRACGLQTVKDQVSLRKLLNASLSSTSTATITPSSELESSQASSPKRCKLTKKQLNELTPEDKRVYLMM